MGDHSVTTQCSLVSLLTPSSRFSARLEFRPKYAVTRAALSPDGRLVAFADKLGSVFVLQLDDNRFQLSAALHSPVTCLAFVDSDAEDVDCDLVVATVDSNAIHFLSIDCLPLRPLLKLSLRQSCARIRCALAFSSE
jgi:hypothetical protein